jgi:hypothetical protein
MIRPLSSLSANEDYFEASEGAREVPKVNFSPALRHRRRTVSRLLRTKLTVANAGEMHGRASFRVLASHVWDCREDEEKGLGKSWSKLGCPTC